MCITQLVGANNVLRKATFVTCLEAHKISAVFFLHIELVVNTLLYIIKFHHYCCISLHLPFPTILPPTILRRYFTTIAPSSSLRQFAVDFVKLEWFDGRNFIRWHKKLHFLLTSLNVVYVLTTLKPQEHENETLAETRVRHKWEQDDYVCKGHICNAMSDTSFDQYHNKPTTKDIWDSLEAKYMMEDTTSKKFLPSKFFNYRMVDNRLVVEQYIEILHILDQFNQHNMNMDESIIAFSIFGKLPLSWKDYKKSLKYSKHEISLDGLGQSLRIEKELKFNNLEDQAAMSFKINVVEERKKFKHSNHPKNNQKRKFDSKENQNKKKKKKGACHHCGKFGHFKRDCQLLKK